MQPNTLRYNKNIWKNCAKIISVRSDKEIQPYLYRLLEWIQDLNWPGAKCIYDRLVCFSDNDSFINEYEKCINTAKEMRDFVWLTNLGDLQKDRCKLAAVFCSVKILKLQRKDWYILSIKKRIQKKNSSEKISKLLFPEFKSVSDCEGNELVVFADSDIKNGFENKVFSDRTSFEAFENHFHIMDKLTYTDMKKIGITGKFLCENYLQLLKKQFPEKSFTVYITAKENEDMILRFHQNWNGEASYYGDESFNDGSLIIKGQTGHGIVLCSGH